MKRFWDKVDVCGPDQCWLWKASKTGGRYGAFSLERGKKIVNAHKFSWELAYGEVPESMVVRHTCDVPACVNPRHLCIGSKKDNSRDMVNRKRSAYGEKNGRTNLKIFDIKLISHWLSRGFKRQHIAEAFDICVKTVSNASGSKHWPKELFN